MEDLIRRLYRRRAIRFGQFTYRNGENYPIYMDLRIVISFPRLLKKLAMMYAEKVLKSDFVAGIPMGGIHLATAISLDLNRPMLLPRNKRKEYGGQNIIEGKYRGGQTVCLIEDIMTTGKSVMNIAKILDQEGLRVSQVICFLWHFPSSKSLKVTTLTNIQQILEVLHSYRAISREIWFTTLNRFVRRGVIPLCKYPRFIREMVNQKKSLLIVALDDTWTNIKKLIPRLSPYVCAFKFHYDLLGPKFNPKELMKLSKIYNFLVIRDRKCGDVAKINRTIVRQNAQHITIVHALPGVTSFPEGPIIVVLEMSTTDGFFTPAYIRNVLKRTSKLPNVIGYVSQHKWWQSYKLCFTPGINLIPTIEHQNAQKYSSPIKKRSHGCDLFIVGSAIIKARNPVEVAKLYQKRTWNPELGSLAQDCYNRLLKFSKERGLTLEEGKFKLLEMKNKIKEG